MDRPTVGRIAWQDLTVTDAREVRDFYSRVTGWVPSGVDMGGYEDFTMLDSDGEAAAGICHARGENADLPPQWLVYIVVEDVESSAAACLEHGGEVLLGPREMGDAVFCVIRDPAGAVCALYRPGR
jgi:predicted enzyme related to lactoylglutathione lyase